MTRCSKRVMKMEQYSATFLTVCAGNAVFILYALNQKFGSPGAGTLVLGLFAECVITPVLTVAGMVSIRAALSSKKSRGLLWLGTAIAAGSGIYLLVAIEHSR
jgi:hypothetical protein